MLSKKVSIIISNWVILSFGCLDLNYLLHNKYWIQSSNNTEKYKHTYDTLIEKSATRAENLMKQLKHIPIPNGRAIFFG